MVQIPESLEVGWHRGLDSKKGNHEGDCHQLLGYYPSLKLNIAPENRPLEKEIPIGTPSFLGASC